MESEKYGSRGITASQLISKSACELTCLNVLSSNATSDLKVYDGENAQGELKLRIRGSASQSKQFDFNPPIYMRRGIYIEFVQKVDFCFVQWKNEPAWTG